jgi:DinB superfamily
MNSEYPQSREQILLAIDRLRDEGLTFWADLPPDQFAAPLGDAWSPADNLRHLIKSTTPVTKGLSLPSLALRMLFGSARTPSASYVGLRDRYQAVLANGATAGRFAPKAARVPSDHAAWQRELVGRCRDSASDLRQAAGRWSEADLEVYRLPHPLLGKLTLREMLFFTLYHFTHHQANVVRRMSAAAGPPN